MRKRGDRLNTEELERLEKFFENNPAIKLAYEFKERLCELLNRKHQMAKEYKGAERNDETDEIRGDTRV
ncbi:MAG: transposase [Opitutales bacterium]|nr:transposase [Opitutales bacterium]